MNKLKLSKFEVTNILFFSSLVLILGLILPIFYLDDINYATETGNIFLQQIREYKEWHGRFFTHIIARFILQYRYTADLLTSIFVAFFFFVSWKAINPHHTIQEKENQRVLLSILCFSLIAFYTNGFWISMIAVVHFMSYRLTLTLLLLYLIPYLRFFTNQQVPPSKIGFLIVSFIAGSTHEQVVVLIPMLIVMAIIWKILNKTIPSWYWKGIILFILGYLTLFLAPNTTSETRLIIYGSALEWDFFGQPLNWLDLGWKRYFYSLVKVLWKWIPHCIAFVVFFITFLILSIKKLKGFSFELVPSVFLFLLGHAIIIVMMFSPVFNSGSMALGGDLMVLSCISILSSYWKIIGFTPKLKEKKILTVVYSITILTWLIQLPPSITYRLAHNNTINIVKQAVAIGDKEVIVPKLKRYGFDTPLGYIRIIYPPSLQKLINYQGYTNIIIIEQ